MDDVDMVTFLATDRCDRCGGQACYRAVMDHGDLLFCGHHSRLHSERLEKDALYTQEVPQ